VANIIGTIAVKLEALTADFKKGMSEVEGLIEKNRQGIGTIAKVSAAGFAAMSGGIYLATKALDEQRQAELRLATAIDASGKAIDPQAIAAYASELQNLTAFGDEATISAGAMLVSMGATQDQVMGLLPAVQDLAAFMGSDLNSAAQLVGKSMTLGAGALTRAGIAMTEVQKKAFDAASQNERVAMVMDLIASKAGGAAQALAGTFSGAMAQVKNQLGEVGEALGQTFEAILVPALQSAADAFRGLADWVKKLSPEMQGAIGYAALLATALLGVTAAVSGLALALPSMTAGFALMGKAATAAGIKMAAAFWPVTAVILLIGIAIASVILAIGIMRKLWDANALGIRTHIEGVIGGFKTLGRGIKEAWGDAMSFMGRAFVKSAEVVGTVFEKMINGLISGVNSFLKANAKIWNMIAGTSAGQALGMGAITVEGFDKVQLNLGDTARWAMDRISRNAADLSANMGANLSQAGDDIAWALTSTWDDGIKTIKGAFGFGGEAIENGALDFGQNLGAAGEDLGAAIDGALGEAEQSIYDFGEAASNLGDATFDVTDAIEKETKAREDLLASFQSELQGLVDETVNAQTALEDASNAAKAWSEATLTWRDSMEAANKAQGDDRNRPDIAGAAAQLTRGEVENQTMADAAKAFAMRFTATLGEAGQSIATTIAVFREQGMWMGLQEIFFQMWSQSKALKDTTVWVTNMVGGLVNALEPVFRGVGYIVKGIVIAIANIWNGILYVLKQVLFAVGADDTARELRKRRIDIANLGEEQAAEEAGKSADDLGNNLDDASEGAQNFGDTMRDVSSSLTNVPEGFKVAAARFKSIEVGGSGRFGAGIGTAQTKQVTINIGTVQTDNAAKFMQDLEREAEWTNVRSGRSIIGGAARALVPAEG
jgi:hypothetical protein